MLKAKYKIDQRGRRWKVAKIYQRVGDDSYNRVTKQLVLTPHVHDYNTPGFVRLAMPNEIPGAKL